MNCNRLVTSLVEEPYYYESHKLFIAPLFIIIIVDNQGRINQYRRSIYTVVN